MTSRPFLATRRSALSAALAGLAALGLPMAAQAQDDQQRILVFGDSQAQGLAGGVQRLFRGDRERRVLDRSKISTGLARLTYDWPTQARTIADSDHANIAVALFGANDRPPVRIGGQIDAGLLDRFSETYGSRVSEIAQDFSRANVPLIWVGHPIVRDAAYAEDMACLNAIFAARATAANAIFVSTWDTFKGPDGAFSAYGRGVDGQTTRLRADDGIHMTPAGYDVITAMLTPLIDRARHNDLPKAISTVRQPSQG
jgi:hypothetical protein